MTVNVNLFRKGEIGKQSQPYGVPWLSWWPVPAWESCRQHSLPGGLAVQCAPLPAPCRGQCSSRVLGSACGGSGDTGSRFFGSQVAPGAWTGHSGANGAAETSVIITE